MTSPLVRCAVYTRKSTEDGLDQAFNSLDAQRDACSAYIQSQSAEGWRMVPDRFDDGGVSGATMERPALKRLLALVERGEIDVIVVYKIDRLTRSLADFARIVERLDAKAASFVSVTQQFNTTSSIGRLTLNVLLSFAQFEREVTSERIRDKIAASKKKGLWMGGRPPLGYDVIDRKLVPNAAEAETVTHIFKAALETCSLTKLEQRLGREGVRTKAWTTPKGNPRGGGPFNRMGLARLLRNPVYIGKIRHKSKVYKGEQPAILDKALWADVQAMLDEGAPARTTASNTPLQGADLKGLLFDDQANRMVPTYVKKKNRIAYRYYVSKPLIRGVHETKGTISRMNAAVIERLVRRALADQRRGLTLDKVSKVTLYKDEVVIALKAEGVRPLETLHIPASLKRPSQRKQIFTTGGRNNQNDGLIKAVAKAWGWRKLLERGAYPTVKDLALAKNLSERYVWKILRLAYLSPALVEAILDGRQPPGLSLRQVNAAQLSPDWGSQAHSLGLDTAR